MLDNQDKAMNENALSDNELEQVSGGKPCRRKGKRKNGEDVSARAWAASNMEAEDKSRARARATDFDFIE